MAHGQAAAAPRGRTRKCPSCRSPQVAAIAYGYPADMEAAHAGVERGEIVLGGCVVTGNDPAWHCRACGHEWGRR